MSENIPDNIRQKFPQLQPINGPPSLMTMNGIGTSMYGKRDYDQETETYVKTRCICFVYIPIFAIGAYRVADAGSRTWYFFGKETLSGFARSWNVAAAGLLVLLGLGITWGVHTSSPEYKAQQEMKRAAALVQSGQPLQAADIYRQQLGGPAAAEANKGFQSAIETCLQSDKARTVAGAFRLMAGARNSSTPDLFDRGLTLVQKFRTTDADGALDILNNAAPFAPTNSSLPALRIDVLKQIVAADPEKTSRVIELAVAYEEAEMMEDSWKLLRPHQHQLGATEGARILGQKLLADSEFADAYELLFPYVQSHLASLHTAEANYTNTLARIEKQAIADLREGRAGKNFYSRYESANKQQQETMVDDYLDARMRADPGLQRSLAALKEANEIVPVALDLGIVQLNRAQGLRDPAARKAELEAAEKTFLSIRTFAGESDEYRMFLGQVYYWLGRSKEGKELFDQLLAKRKRGYLTLMQLSRTLRSVGETADARALAEEAYRTSKSSKEKFEAASLRSLTFKDDDDQIAWLEKADPDSTWTQIELNSARGKKALRDGKKTAAADFLRKAIAGYGNQPKTPASLNNCGLACFDLYQATGNVEDQRRGTALLEEAMSMDPGDSILLQNAMYHMVSLAVLDVVGDSIHVGALGQHAGLAMLAHLYTNDQQRAVIYQQLHASEPMKKGLGYLDKALLLAPKDLGLYSTALSLHTGFRDLGELQKLDQRLHVAAPDLTEIRQETLEAYAGAKDKERQEQLLAKIRVLNDLARTPAVSGHALTLEQVNVSLVELRQQYWISGGTLDGRTLLDSAQAVHQKHQSASTRYALKSAYFFRASEELAQQNPDFAALVTRSRRALSPELLLVFILERGGPLSDLARKNQNIAKALALEKEILVDFPTWINISEWAMLRASEPDAAATLAGKFKDNEMVKLSDRLQFELNPLSATAILEQYWTHKVLGDEKRATEIYQTALRDGVPLPPL